MKQPRTYDVIVLGAGIIGASIAWHLGREGMHVAVVDASGPAAGASGAADGAVSVASKRPGAMMSLAGASLRYCGELARGGGVLAGVFRSRPSFIFAVSERDEDALERLSKRLREGDTTVSVVRDGSAGDAAIDGLSSEVTRVMELAGEGHMLGYAATAAFLASSGADFHWPCRVDCVEVGNGDVRLHTNAGELRGTKVVVANGLGSIGLFPELPLLPRSGQLIVTDRATGPEWRELPGSLTSAAYLLDKSERGIDLDRAPVVIDPLRTGQLLIGSSREDNGTADQTDFATVRRILSAGVACWPALAERRVIRVFAGVRTASEDGLPIVGTKPDAPNLIFATGFEGDGICLAPVIGSEVAKLVSGAPTTSELATLSPDRFRQKMVAMR